MTVNVCDRVHVSACKHVCVECMCVCMLTTMCHACWCGCEHYVWGTHPGGICMYPCLKAGFPASVIMGE